VHTAAITPPARIAATRSSPVKRGRPQADMPETNDTYKRLFWEHHEAEWKHLAGMRECLDKLQKRVS
jgi:hypothetical protein